MAACNKNTPEEPNGGKGTGAVGEPTEVILTLASPATRASEAGTAAENAIKTVEFYVFDDLGAVDDQVGTGNGYVKFTMDGEISKRVIVGSGTDKKFVAAVNTDMGPLAAGDGYDELKAMIASGEFTADETLLDHNARTTPTGGFEMTGEVVADITAGSITNTVTIEVARLASKMYAPTFIASDGINPSEVNLTDLQIKQLWPNDYEDIDPADLSFTFGGYALINGLDKSDAFFIGNANGDDEEDSDSDGFPDWDLWSWTGKNYLNSSFITADGLFKGHYTNNYSGKSVVNVAETDPSLVWFLLGSTADNSDRVYIYENKPDVTTIDGQTGFDPKKTYAFIIKGDLKVDGEPTLTKTRYWRVDLTRTDNYHIKRNSVYKVNVQTIISIGYPTPQDAEEKPGVIPGGDQTAVEIFIEVLDWRLNVYETQM